MKNKCRILSVIVTVILTSITLITTINLIIKPKDEIIYAESINFVNGIRSAEILLDNRLVVDENLVEVAPKNCSFTPEFTIKKYGTSEETVINGYYTFPKTGTYTIACKINSGKNYYEKDSMSITIVETPTSSTIMYIIDKHVSLHENDEIDLFSVANIVKPENSSIKVETNSNLQFYNNTIKAVKEGKGEINITLTYYNIIINLCKDLFIKSPELFRRPCRAVPPMAGGGMFRGLLNYFLEVYHYEHKHSASRTSESDLGARRIRKSQWPLGVRL